LDNNINFNQEAKEIVNSTVELAALEAQEVIRPSAEQVKQAARDLIAVTEEIRLKAQSNMSYLENVKAGEDDGAAYKFSKKMVTQKEDFKMLMEKVLNFQNMANAFLGQKVQMTFVAISSKGEAKLYAVENSIEDIALDKAAESRGGDWRGRYRQGLIKKVAQQIVNSNYDSNSLDNTFQNVYTRYKISKNRLKLLGAAYILWKDPKWEGVWISGAGPLGEAYVNFFVNEIFFNSGIEKNVKNFMLDNKYGAVKADNASGFLQGDVTKGALEFGVKINAATAMGYMEIIQYAEDLLESTDIEKFLLDLKRNLAEKGANNMVKPINNILNEEVQNQLNPIMQAIEQGLTK